MTTAELTFAKPQEFFREKINTAVSKHNIQLDDDVEFYIVNMLCNFIAPEKVESVVGRLSALDTPLALMLKQAIEAPVAERARIYKYLGDTSLYVSGFFQDYFNRKCFDITYYMTLGASAFNSLAELTQESNENFSTVYSDISSNFHELVEVIADVSDNPDQRGPVDLLMIYDRWSHTQSNRLRRLLEQHGITPIPTAPRAKQ